MPDITIGGFEGWGLFCHIVVPYGKAGGLQILCCQGIAVRRLQLHP